MVIEKPEWVEKTSGFRLTPEWSGKNEITLTEKEVPDTSGQEFGGIPNQPQTWGDSGGLLFQYDPG
jgi:hypothetical protein